MDVELTRERPESADHHPDSPADGFADAAPKLVSARSRCPYCHEEVRAERADWLACEGCLAKHHTSCWHERGSCASCHGRGVLVRGRGRRRFIVGVFALAVLVTGGISGAFSAGRAVERRRPEPPDAAPAAATARDEALLGLGFFSQTRHNEHFMNRMIAAAERYEAQGKAADAKLLRDVATVAIEKGPEAGFELLKQTSESKPTPDVDATKEKRDAILAKIALAEHEIALDANVADGDDRRTRVAKALLELSQLYTDAGLPEDAKRVSKAADALVLRDKDAALALLRFPGSPGESASARDQEIAAVRAREKKAYVSIEQITKSLSKPTGKDLTVGWMALIEVGADYEKLGLAKDAERARDAGRLAADGQGAKALEVLAGKSE